MPAMLAGACLFFGVTIAVLLRNSNRPIAVADNSRAVPPKTPERTKEVLKPESNGGTPGGMNETALGRPVESVSEFFAVETDDGQLLWAPPQAGTPYSLELFPAGLEAMVFVSGNL